MKKIKDLIYDYNDIFVAILILAAAAAIILWRVTDIMAYPEYLADKEQAHAADVDFSDVDLTPTNIDDFNETPEDVNTGAETEPGQTEPGQTEPAPAGEQTDAPATPQTDSEGNYRVEIPKGSSAGGIARILADQGIISSEDEFLDKVDEMGATMKMKYGSYKIPQGSTLEEIINILM